MTYERQTIGITFAAFACAVLVVPANATCAYPPELPAQLKDGQPAHSADVIDYISACPNFTGNARIAAHNDALTISVGANPGGLHFSSAGTDAYFGVQGPASGYVLANGVNYSAFIASDRSISLGQKYGPTRMFVDTTTGNVGIGTTSPAAKLDVAGDLNVQGNTTHNSDVRLKTGVAALGFGAIDAIMKLRPVNFHWIAPKDDGMKGTQTGFIAQEVEKVLPSTVFTARDAMKTKGIKYNDLTAVLIKAVQEQQAIIEKQTRGIAALRAENAKQRAVTQDQAKQMSELKGENRVLTARLQQETRTLAARLDWLERTRVAKVQ